MGQYEMLWNERKEFLKVSVVIGAIIALVTNIIFAFKGAFDGNNLMDQILAFIIIYFCLAIFFIPATILVRMMGGRAEGYGIGLLSGLWTSLVGTIFGSERIIILGLLQLLLFGFLFAVVACGYVIYIPISSIYYFIKYKQESKAA